MSDPVDARVAGRLSIAYMMTLAGEVLHRFPVDMLDLLLVTTIARFNLMADAPGPRERLTDATPPRIGISRNAVSRALNVPLETVRRRVAGLIEKNILVEQSDGLAFAPDNPVGLGTSAELADFNLDQLRRLFHALREHGIDLS